jgi:DNA mismatch repair protein MSH3
MGGKSSYLRQLALVVLMAQVGSYVPATSVRLHGLFDGVYTRMGASDSLTAGRSTFFVELQQTANILRHATRRSLVILDELGRGTSTHDGTAVAVATLRYLVDRQIPTLFVTHYPVLADLATQLAPAGRNFHMGYIDDAEGLAGQRVTFLYQLMAGAASRSFGLNVGRLARLPASLLSTAAGQSAALETATRRRTRAALFARFAQLVAKFPAEGTAAHPPALQALEELAAQVKRAVDD